MRKQQRVPLSLEGCRCKRCQAGRPRGGAIRKAIERAIEDGTIQWSGEKGRVS